MSDVAGFPLVVTAVGPQPTPPATLRAGLIAAVAAINPGYTATLPGSLIEDVSSTDVGALVTIDSARVEAVNSLTPSGANAFTLAQLGQIYIGPGAAPAPPTNTSVFVVFTVEDLVTTDLLPGYVIPIGFTVSDGTYQYVVQDGGITASNGMTSPLFCLATVTGSWAIPTNTVSEVISSYDTVGFLITCSNPLTGTPGNAVAETEEQYRARVLQAGQAIATGTAQLLKTLLGLVPGVQQNLISVVQQGTLWEIIVGGGDPYQIAGAIFASGINIAGLTGSIIAITNITQANPGVVTTDINHGLTTGAQETLSQIVGMTPLNGVLVTVTVISETTFSIGINTTGYPAYVSGGIVSPNPRNVTVDITNPPDVYGITFVVPPQQSVILAVTWNTTEANFVAQASVAQLAGPPLVDYLNELTPGQPINLNVATSIFLAAVDSIISPDQVSVLQWAVSINGIPTSPEAGTQLVFGDPESYFFATASSVTFVQG